MQLHSGHRRSNIVWTNAAVRKVLDMFDVGRAVTKRYTFTQIAEQLNRKETDHIYKHPNDSGRVFTRNNVMKLIMKMFPAKHDTQAGINILGTCPWVSGSGYIR